MKTKLKLTLAALGLTACLQPALAQLTIPSDGSDGAFNPPASPTNVVIDLSQAVTGVWNANNSANAGKGIYDPEKWAVVFKYSSVNIPAGVTVSFKNHSTHAPVVWLVQGDVAINGALRLNGVNGSASGTVLALTPAEAGPGGFRGGPKGPPGSGAGLGPGGGDWNVTDSGRYASVYGNPQVLPLIGGSGSRVDHWGDGSGGGGGGAILIAAAGSVSNQGLISCKGGDGLANRGASGGAVRVIASQVLAACRT